MPKFIADSMLGKLSKWLRIIGYDTLYFRKIEPKSIAKISNSEKRIILTRNSHLSELQPYKLVYINSTNIDEQLKQIISEFKIDTKSRLFSICTLCNTKVKKIKKEEVKDKVPSYIFKNNSSFYICQKCQKIYWQGSHYHNSIRKINELVI